MIGPGFGGTSFELVGKEDKLPLDMPLHVILRANVIESAGVRIGQAKNMIMGSIRTIQSKKGPSFRAQVSKFCVVEAADWLIKMGN